MSLLACRQYVLGPSGSCQSRLGRYRLGKVGGRKSVGRAKQNTEDGKTRESGNFRGAVGFDAGGVSLASSDLVLDLDFRDDGTIARRVDTDASLLWPQPVAIVGTWTPRRAGGRAARS